MRIFISIIIFIGFATVAQAQNYRLVDRIGHWHILEKNQGGVQICAAFSCGQRRCDGQPTRLTVIVEPDRGRSFTFYEFTGDVSPQTRGNVVVSGNRYSLSAAGGLGKSHGLFTRTEFHDGQMTAHLRAAEAKNPNAGVRVQITAPASAKGDSYVFALRGFSAAYDAVAQRCNLTN